MDAKKPLRVLIVDDSVIERAALAAGLSASGFVEVVGSAADGGEALRVARQLKPDVITLDLEMPKLDGFSFLRLLMSGEPIPVVVVSGHSQKENVFRALELGAVDFVAKPEGAPGQVDKILDQLLDKLRSVRNLEAGQLSLRPFSRTPAPHLPAVRVWKQSPVEPPHHIVAIAASTGGPAAVTEIVSKLGVNESYAVLVAQHMPENFTKVFAERLDGFSALRVVEAADGDWVTANTVYVCPGRSCMELERSKSGQLRIHARSPRTEDRYVPSANRLFSSVARMVGASAIGVVLTGMGDDGVDGARDILKNGGTVIAESEETAIVYGMPRAVIREGVVTRSLPLHGIASHLMELVSRPRKTA